jgi:hypothetical protein
VILEDVLLAFGPHSIQSSIESPEVVLNVPSGQSTQCPISMVWLTGDSLSLSSFSGVVRYIPGLHGSHSVDV